MMPFYLSTFFLVGNGILFCNGKRLKLMFKLHLNHLVQSINGT